MSQSNPGQTLEQTRTKLIQVFRYVQAFHQLHNPVAQDVERQSWFMWFHDLPEHSSIIRGMPTHIEHESTEDEEYMLKVSRPTLTEAPEPPKDVVTWLQDGWQYVDGRVAIDPTKIADMKADLRRKKLLEDWLLRRDKWATDERPARRAMDIYDKLRALCSQLERESERLELVLGDGILDWHPAHSNSGVHHPVLLTRVQIRFNPQIPEITLSETEHPSEFYTSLFQTLSTVNPRDIARSRADFEQGSWQPLGGDETNQFLKRLVHQLSPTAASKNLDPRV